MFSLSLMRRLTILSVSLLAGFILSAQKPEGRWLVYEGGDGAELVVNIPAEGPGKAELSLTRRHQAVSYGEGSQFWGTFHATGGYYFLVRAVKTVGISLAQTDSTLTVTRRGEPVTKVSAWLDEAYSTRDLSDYGDYKKQVLAQWKRDFPHNEDVAKGKWMMERYFTDFYDNAFDVLLFGEYRIAEKTDSALVLKKCGSDGPRLTWTRSVQ